MNKLFLQDEILKALEKTRDRPITERESILVNEFLDKYKVSDRHEDFIELVKTLINDGYAILIKDKQYSSEVDKYRDCLITVSGSDFISKGGYKWQEIRKTIKQIGIGIVIGVVSTLIVYILTKS